MPRGFWRESSFAVMGPRSNAWDRMSDHPAPPVMLADHPNGAWGRVVTPLDDATVIQRLDKAARQGKLPGFRRGPGGALFSVSAFGHPLDYELRAFRSTGEPQVLVARGVMPLHTPALIALACVASVWPGLPLTDSLVRTYFPSYQFDTWIWYLPLTLLPLPSLLIGMVRRSKRAALEHARETLGHIVACLDETVP